MNTEEIIATHQQYVMPTYAPSLVLTRGKGMKVWDAEGNEYLDFLSGIAVDSVGHCHPHVVKAIKQQAGTLMHVSNLYFNQNQPRLAKELATRSLGGKCFFCNSGAEANEALIKLARLWGHEQGKYEIVTMQGSFHGRTLATLTATGQDKVQKGFEPLPDGFAYATFNNLDSVAAAITERTAAVLVEPVQGEGGVVPATQEFMQGLRALCDERGILLFCDEVQTGVGRTGHWFGYQAYGIEPDALSLAKGLGGGFPIGAIATSPALADVFQPGHHATTFGGTPLASAAALAVLEVITENDLVTNAAEMGKLLVKQLERATKRDKRVVDVRGHGLMIGVVLDQPAKELEQIMIKKGILVLATAGNVIRFLPPLIVKAAQVRKAAKVMKESLDAWVT